MTSSAKELESLQGSFEVICYGSPTAHGLCFLITRGGLVRSTSEKRRSIEVIIEKMLRDHGRNFLRRRLCPDLILANGFLR